MSIEADRRYQRVVAGISLLLIVGVVLFGALVVRDFNNALEPELAKRAALIGETVRDDADHWLHRTPSVPLAAVADLGPAWSQSLDFLVFVDEMEPFRRVDRETESEK